MRKCIFLMSAVVCLTASAQHIRETLTLEKGWNAVYLESTPDEADCEAFFAGLPVTGAGAYMSDAFEPKASYASNGELKRQQPIAYLQWVRGSRNSTLKRLSGGMAYLVFATNAAEKTFLGIPERPLFSWHRVAPNAADDEFYNLVGVSVGEGDSPAAAAYFEEGPYGTDAGARQVWGVGGASESGPELKSIGFLGRAPKVSGGRAYALTATEAREWGGVISVEESAGLVLTTEGETRELHVSNAGTKARAFRFTVRRSAEDGELFPPLRRRLPRTDLLADDAYAGVEADASWEVALAPGETAAVPLSVDPARATEGDFAAVFEICDLGGTCMRVRVPIAVAVTLLDTVAADRPALLQAAQPPVAASGPKFSPENQSGLWVGAMVLDKVSQYDNFSADSATNPVPSEAVAAAGNMPVNLIVHVTSNGTVRLLQRVAIGANTNGVRGLYHEYAQIPTSFESRRLHSTGMMSVENREVVALSGSEAMGRLCFSWTVGEKARDNPFRHAWHPDHDGKTADYAKDAPTGDVPESYLDPIKPELWSISNRLDLVSSSAVAVNAQSVSGQATWTVWGLVSGRPIVTTGQYMLNRVLAIPEIKGDER